MELKLTKSKKDKRWVAKGNFIVQSHLTAKIVTHGYISDPFYLLNLAFCSFFSSNLLLYTLRQWILYLNLLITTHLLIPITTLIPPTGSHPLICLEQTRLSILPIRCHHHCLCTTFPVPPIILIPPPITIKQPSVTLVALLMRPPLAPVNQRHLEVPRTRTGLKGNRWKMHVVSNPIDIGDERVTQKRIPLRMLIQIFFCCSQLSKGMQKVRWRKTLPALHQAWSHCNLRRFSSERTQKGRQTWSL